MFSARGIFTKLINAACVLQNIHEPWSSKKINKNTKTRPRSDVIAVRVFCVGSCTGRARLSECRQKKLKARKRRNEIFCSICWQWDRPPSTVGWCLWAIRNRNLFALYLSLSNPQKWNCRAFFALVTYAFGFGVIKNTTMKMLMMSAVLLDFEKQIPRAT